MKSAVKALAQPGVRRRLLVAAWILALVWSTIVEVRLGVFREPVHDESGLGHMMVMFTIGVFYFLPAILGRRIPKAWRLWLFNLFLGWTALGWFTALIWACLADAEKRA